MDKTMTLLNDKDLDSVKPRCTERVLKFRKGQEPLLEQCKRYAIKGSDRCSLHTKNYKAPRSEEISEEQNSIR